MKITHHSTLPVGVEIGGQTVKGFTVRPALARDSVEAIETHGADASPSRLRMAVEALQVTLDGIDAPLTLDMLLDMYEKDYVAVTEAIAEVEKKLQAQSAN